MNRTLVVVTADHGEAFGEHGEDGHGIFVYQTTMHVPLIVRGPQVRTARVKATVRLVDVTPTILEIAGIHGATMDGRSLLPLLTGAAADLGLEAYSESLYPERFGFSRVRSLRGDRYKLIESPRPELYDLVADPAERQNRHSERPLVAAAIAARLGAFDDGAVPLPPATLDPEHQQDLKALGYIGTSQLRPSTAGALPDAKDFIAIHNARTNARPADQVPCPARQ